MKQWLDFTFPHGVFDETQYITAFLSTLDDRFQYTVSDFKNCTTKNQALAVINSPFIIGELKLWQKKGRVTRESVLMLKD